MNSEEIPQEIQAYVFKVIQRGALDSLTKQEMAAWLDRDYKAILGLMLIQKADVSRRCKESCNRFGIITLGDFLARRAQSRNGMVRGVVNQKDLHDILDHLDLIRLFAKWHLDEVLGSA